MGDLLVKEFSANIRPGQNTFIYGPSGSGKSSLVRLLAGIWKCRQGSAHVVTHSSLTRHAILYAPQQPVMICGSLIDQLY